MCNGCDRVVISIGCSLSEADREWVDGEEVEDIAEIIRKSHRRRYGFISESESFLRESTNKVWCIIGDPIQTCGLISGSNLIEITHFRRLASL
jgi:hypothetical protein